MLTRRGLAKLKERAISKALVAT